MESLKRRYYSQRKGITNKITFPELKISVSVILKKLFQSGYYDEWFGYECVDGNVSGKAGNDIEGYIYLRTRRHIHWPILNEIIGLNEDSLFDMIEFFHDTVSFPEEGYEHRYNSCGWHFTSFNQEKGQQIYRDQINEILSDYSNGYYINKVGEIEIIHAPELSKLMENDLPSLPEEELQIKERVDLAIAQFRNRHSTFTERQSAVRELANVLEYLLPLIKKSMLTNNDERDLFNIANNFCIRHNDRNQKNNYSIEWLSWIFHVYLATIHFCLWSRKRN